MNTLLQINTIRCIFNRETVANIVKSPVFLVNFDTVPQFGHQPQQDENRNAVCSKFCRAHRYGYVYI